MRSIFAAMVMLTASMGLMDAAPAQQRSHALPGYGFTQAPIGRPQPTRDDIRKLERDNEDLDLPASRDEVVRAGQVHTEEDLLTKQIDQDNARLDREVRGICGGC
jgi:hypothetical protein